MSFKFILFHTIIKSLYNTALHLAVSNNKIEIIKLLLNKNGININIKNGIQFLEKNEISICDLWLKLIFLCKTPIDLTDDKDIIELFNSHMIRILDANMIDELLKTKKKIGEGAASKVYKVQNIFTKNGFLCLKIIKDAVIKKIVLQSTKKRTTWDDNDEDDDDDDNADDAIEIDFDKMKSLYTEYEMLFHLNHPNIVKTYGFFFGDKTHNPAILLEYCKFNLEKVINKFDDLELENYELVGFIYEICSAMKYVHEKKIIHRDLKMTNILVTKKHIKICDFGIARSMDMETFSSFTKGIGTFRFMAPEIVKEEINYNEKVDVFSFGVVMYFLVTKGKLPKGSPENYVSLKFPNTINNLSKQIIKSCWLTQPDQRPSFEQIMQEIVNNNFMLIDGIEDKIPQLKNHLGI